MNNDFLTILGILVLCKLLLNYIVLGIKLCADYTIVDMIDEKITACNNLRTKVFSVSNVEAKVFTMATIIMIIILVILFI